MKTRMLVPVWMLHCACLVLIGGAAVPTPGDDDIIDDIIDLDADLLTSEPPAGVKDADHTSQYYFRGHWGSHFLPLSQTPHIDLNAPLCTVENDTLVCRPGNDKSTVFYEDSTGNVAVSISKENGHFKLGGIVRASDGAVYEYQPRPSEGAQNTHVRRKRWTATLIHRRVASSGAGEASFGAGNQFGSPKWNASPGTSYCVDVLCVVDYSIYKKFFAEYKTSSKAEDKIRYYYAHVINGINMRYASLQKSGINIKIRLAGYLIAKKSTDLPFMKAYLLSSDPNYRVNGRQTLENLDKFLKSTENRSPRTLPAFNHAMLFLEYTATTHGGTVLGTSFVMGMCSSSHSTSMVVDHGAFTASGIGCHELGHNLGVKDHDGEGGAGPCNASKNHVMAPASYLIDKDNLQYSFSFSSCSIDQIRNMLRSLGDSSCLQCGALSPGVKKQTDDYLRELPGVSLSVHDQCKQLYGEGSFMCPPKSPTEMCYRMYCYDPQRSACAIISEQMAAPGTPCGYKKWCIMGKCVSGTSAPAVPDECPYPDIPDEGAHCEDACPFMCANEKFRQKCCASCNKAASFSQDQCCKDLHVPINGMSCSRLMQEAYARGLCEQDPNVQSFCCSSCKALLATPDPRESLLQLPSGLGVRGRVVQHSGIWNALSSLASRSRVVPSSSVKQASSSRKHTKVSSECVDNMQITINSVKCPEIVAQHPKQACFNPDVRKHCCASCKRNRGK